MDCDNTLWSGVCGESGPLGVVIAAPRRAFQQFLMDRRAEGFLLCLFSKNGPEDVEAVFRENPDMLIPREAFIHAAVNWDAKSSSLRSIATKLGLGLDSFLLLDDNPAEIAEVAANDPAALAICLPENPRELPGFLDHLWVLDRTTFTAYDATRADFYQHEAGREELRARTSSFTEFLEGLQLEMEVTPLADLARASQLTQRTNRFNANPQPLDEARLASMVRGARAELMQVRDRFGDYGTVGMTLCRVDGQRLLVEGFLLSCRALGRGVEQRMLSHLGALAKNYGLTETAIRFTDTGRNRPCRDFLENLSGAIWEGGLRVVPADLAVDVPLVPANAAAPVIDASELTAPLVDPVLATRIAHELRMAEVILAWAAKPVFPRPDTGEMFVPPQREAEEKVAAIWSAALGLDRVGRNDRSVDLGGDSLQRGYLRHRDRIHLLQSITFRLADSLPQTVLKQLEAELHLLPEARRDIEKRKSIEHWLDAGMGCCALRNAEAAAFVQKSLLHFDGDRYRVLAWAIMPNHAQSCPIMSISSSNRQSRFRRSSKGGNPSPRDGSWRTMSDSD